MFSYGKTASKAIAALSCLVSVYRAGGKLGSSEIAKARGISRALAAKLMVQLSTAGFVIGYPGPRGGYRLAKEPSAITLFEIVAQFEKVDAEPRCPFGDTWCGKEEPCPLHDAIVEMDAHAREYLQKTTLAVFEAYPFPLKRGKSAREKGAN